MTAYIPHDPSLVLAVLGVGGGVFLLGWLLQRQEVQSLHVGLAWGMTMVVAFGVEWLIRREPPGVRMTAIILALLWSLKLVVLASFQLDGGPRLPPLRWFAFLFGWLGMQPAIFARPFHPNGNFARQFAARGLLRTILGIAFLVAARGMVRSPEDLPWKTMSATVATLLLLVGVSLVLHFGLVNLLAAGWQTVGINCQPLFRAPLASKSLSEFWSRRWNLAFSEMTAIAVYRPCRRRLGHSTALFTGFAFSGLIHESAISVPAWSGFGGPFSYFALHGLLVLLERRYNLSRRCGASYRAWVVFSLAAPLPLLFPPTFLREIVWPLAGVNFPR
jgi:hypothetical protein